jgi:hypothetical protein
MASSMGRFCSAYLNISRTNGPQKPHRLKDHLRASQKYCEQFQPRVDAQLPVERVVYGLVPSDNMSDKSVDPHSPEPSKADAEQQGAQTAVNPTISTGEPHQTAGESSSILALNPARKAWRVIATLLVFGSLTAGQIIHTNDWFPLGTLSQYSYGRPLDAPTRAVRVMAINTDGEEVRVPLSVKGSGVQRAELEGQLDRILEDPSILEAIARSWHGLHPDKPQYVELRLERVTHYIKDGIPTGESDVEILTNWTVAGNYQQETK